LKTISDLLHGTLLALEEAQSLLDTIEVETLHTPPRSSGTYSTESKANIVAGLRIWAPGVLNSKQEEGYKESCYTTETKEKLGADFSRSYLERKVDSQPCSYYFSRDPSVLVDLKSFEKETFYSETSKSRIAGDLAKRYWAEGGYY
jgi:hypothetical protein